MESITFISFDAVRLKIYRKSASFPNVTKITGLRSIRSVIKEDATFPATKQELIEKQGWKVFDLEENEHVHARILLERLPNGKYATIEDVIGELKKTDGGKRSGTRISRMRKDRNDPVL